MLIQDQFGIIQNLQMSPIPQTQTKLTTWLGLFLPFLTANQLQETSQYIIIPYPNEIHFQNANEQIKTYLKQFNEIETNLMDWGIVCS